MRQDGVVEADFVVGAGVLRGRGAGEAVVYEEFVVGVRAVGGEDFFARFCGVSVLVFEVCEWLSLTCSRWAVR